MTENGTSRPISQVYNRQDKPSLWRRGVERFRQTPKADVSQPKCLKRLDQLLHGTREAVEFPHNDSIPRARKFERVAQRRPLQNHARHLLNEKLRATRFRQRVSLQGQILVEGRNPRIADENAIRMHLAVRTRRRRLTRLLRGRATDATDSRHRRLATGFLCRLYR